MVKRRIVYKCFACGLERATKRAAERHARNCNDPIRLTCGCSMDAQNDQVVRTPCEQHKQVKGAAT